MVANLLNVNVRETLAFFDEKPRWSERQAPPSLGCSGRTCPPQSCSTASKQTGPPWSRYEVKPWAPVG